MIAGAILCTSDEFAACDGPGSVEMAAPIMVSQYWTDGVPNMVEASICRSVIYSLPIIKWMKMKGTRFLATRGYSYYLNCLRKRPIAGSKSKSTSVRHFPARQIAAGRVRKSTSKRCPFFYLAAELCRSSFGHFYFGTFCSAGRKKIPSALHGALVWRFGDISALLAVGLPPTRSGRGVRHMRGKENGDSNGCTAVDHWA